MTPEEHCDILDIVRTGSEDFNKLTLVFSSLVTEMVNLQKIAKEKFFPAIILFGGMEDADEGEIQLQIGRLFPVLIDMHDFVERCYSVIKNTITQLGSLYHNNSEYYRSTFKKVQLQVVYSQLSNILITLFTLDEIIGNSQTLDKAWGRYRGMINQMERDPEKYNVEDPNKLFQLRILMERVTSLLLNQNIFKTIITHDYRGLEPIILKNPVLKKEFENYLNSSVRMFSSKAVVDSHMEIKYLSISVFYTLYCCLFHAEDKNTLKRLWDFNKKIPLIHLYGDCTWDSCSFFADTIPILVKKYRLPELRDRQKEFLLLTLKNMEGTINQLYGEVSAWIIYIENNAEQIEKSVGLLMKGIELAQTISSLYRKVIHLHTTTGVKIRSSTILYIFRCMEILKTIRAIYHRKSVVIANTLNIMVKKIATNIQSIMFNIRDKVEESIRKRQNPSPEDVDLYAAINLAIQMLNGPGSSARLLVFRLVLARIMPFGLLKDPEIKLLISQLSLLDKVTSFGELVIRATDTSDIYWFRNRIKYYIDFMYNNPGTISRMKFLFSTLQDCITLFAGVAHCDPGEMVDKLIDFIDEVLREHLLVPIASGIHKLLVVHVHNGTKSNLLGKDINERVDHVDPFLSADYAKFIELPALYLCNYSLDISDFVSHYLDRILYNLNTVALWNWQTFEEIRSLAKDMFKINLREVHLPGQTIEQGVDVLTIMRKLQPFARQYCYNMNNQIFIERENSKANTLKTINIHHIANSIRTHGTGIMNTTVSVAYQFLRDKIHFFSQFLYDELIKSRLSEDILTFEDIRKDNSNACFPHGLARDCQSFIRSIGQTEDGKSYLEKFRIHITEIGNIMGYIRMVRSGGQLYTSNALQFVPDLSSINSFKEALEKDSMSRETIESAQVLDGVITTLYQNFTEGTDYFRALVDVFKSEYRNERNSHLRAFYIILPALTINFVDHITECQDKFAKRGREEGSWTDDGFVIGVAYLLKLLDLNEQFDSLQWFDSVRIYVKEERSKITQKKKERQVTTAHYTQGILEKYQKQFQLLEYSLTSARVLYV
eukprot:TRINITY_DN8022_c0_g1_i1.p1 TRINITY_DN8022_c0_g1~~TRINITY_DN8022_c0_g1_i1.p1  ORF type:complete len:1121 (+),score=206.56 TRINITY_DN8022_c0_g1_i1:196-3363(+)